MIDSNTVGIFGCGGHARSVVDVLLDNDPSANVVFIDEKARENEKIFSLQVVSGIDFHEVVCCFVAIGDNLKRETMFAEAKKKSQIVNIVSKLSYLSNFAITSDGLVMQPDCLQHHFRIGSCISGMGDGGS